MILYEQEEQLWVADLIFYTESDFVSWYSMVQFYLSFLSLCWRGFVFLILCVSIDSTRAIGYFLIIIIFFTLPPSHKCCFTPPRHLLLSWKLSSLSLSPHVQNPLKFLLIMSLVSSVQKYLISDLCPAFLLAKWVSVILNVVYLCVHMLKVLTNVLSYTVSDS